MIITVICSVPQVLLKHVRSEMKYLHKAIKNQNKFKNNLDTSHPLRMAIMKTTENKIWQGCGEVEILLHC